MKNKEIASKLQISESTVCRQLQVAKDKIYAVAQCFSALFWMQDQEAHAGILPELS